MRAGPKARFAVRNFAPSRRLMDANLMIVLAAVLGRLDLLCEDPS